MNFLLAIGKGDYSDAIIQTKGFGETAVYGLGIVLNGMLIIFAVLGLIWACLSIFKMVFHDLPAKNSEPNEQPVKLPVEVKETVAEVTTSDDEIIAVIAAAIAAAESESGGAKFRVVSFRRK